jgi:hypothetical protein
LYFYSYAYLGFVDSGYGIQPDYTENNTLDKLLVDTAQMIILRERDLFVLNYVAPWEPGQVRPSWVPDWTCLHDDAGGSSGGNPFTFQNPEAQFTHNGRILSVSGVLMGSVQPMAQAARRSMYPIAPNCYARRKYGDEVVVADQVWLLYGTNSAFVLREVEGTLKFLGLCWVMDSSGMAYEVDLDACTPVRVCIG